jgi:hypothetical protein
MLIKFLKGPGRFLNLKKWFLPKQSIVSLNESPRNLTEDDPEKSTTNRFGDDHFEKILPSYLTSSAKDRLKEGLSQFFSDAQGKDITYEGFYSDDTHAYFKQSDLIAEVRSPQWNSATGEFERIYSDSMLLSNTCDVNPDNPRITNTKQSIFAPIVNFREYLHDLRKNGVSETQINSFEIEVKRQRITNIFYLPPFKKDGPDYITLLDQPFWLSSAHLNSRLVHISEDKIKSLADFGFYLFIFKLSYHFCRLPEEADRSITPLH